MLGKAMRLWRRFQHCERGNIAIIFALILVPTVGVGATAIDFGRASKVRSQLQNASDAAAQQASLMLDAPLAQIRAKVQAHLRANLPVQLHDVPFEVVIASNRKLVEIRMETRVPTTILAMTGTAHIDVAILAEARRHEPVIQAVGEPASNHRTSPLAVPARDIVQELRGAGIEVSEPAARAIEHQMRLLEELTRKANQGELPPELAAAMRGLQRR